MAGRWRDPTAFRADPSAVPATRPSRRQSLALLLVLAVVAGSVAAVSYLVRPDDARSFDLFRGSVFLADTVAPVAVDLATGRPTVRLVDASGQVGAKRAEDLGVLPTAGGTLLLNRLTGEFNMVQSTGFVVKKDGGVPLPRRAGADAAVGIAAQDFSYIEQTGPTGTSVYLVGSTTVQSAAAGATAVKPRAFRSMTEPTGTAPGTAAAVGNDLWLLAGTGTQRTVRELSLPVDSNPGATLTSRDVATVSGPAAIGTAGAVSDDAGSTGDTSSVAAGSVGIASADRIVVQRGTDKLRTVRFTAPAGVDQVLAATNGTDRLSYLLHGLSGWSTVSVAADGTDLQGPTALGQIATGARLVAPAASEGMLYTMDATSGDLVLITAAGRAQSLPGLATYPVAEQNGRTIEAGGFDDAYVLARGPRVVFNSPNHLLALAVFADGSRAPLPIQKSAAVSVNAAGGAEALARSRTENAPPAKTTAPGQPKPIARPVDPVNNKIDCETTSQEPHIPAFGQPVPGSRSVLLQWSYPINDRSDCIPKTYVVKIRALDSGTPTPPSSVTVDGQLGVNVSGLFPSSRYEITVTAYINGKGTASAPIRITTGPEGPGAPRQVAVSTDDAGNWQLTWSSCGTVASGCVPSATWRVVPQFCDSRGLASPPAPFEVLADPTATQQPGASLQGSSALLGRGLRFQVEGIGADGQVGTPSGSTSCATSWSPPVASALRFTASKPADAAAGATTSTTLSLALGSDAIRDVGGVGATVTFTLDGPGDARTKTVTVDGRSSNLTAGFDGITPGAQYTATAKVSPPGHPDAAVTLNAPSITPVATWPALSIDAQCPSSGLFSCNLVVRIKGVSSAGTGGETFDLTSDSRLQCGSTARTLTGAGFDPSTTSIRLDGVSQTDKLFGACTVTLGLVESSSQRQPLYFGGTVSGSASDPVDLGQAERATVSPSDFSAQWPSSGSSATIKYTGNQKNLGDLTKNWGEVLHRPEDSSCGTASTQFANTGDTASVPGNDCVGKYGDQTSGWSITVTYSDQVDGTGHSVEVPLAQGAPASYQPCTPGTFTATWGATKALGVAVNADGALDGCTSWRLQLVAPDGTSCGDPVTAAPSATTFVPINCGTPPSAGDWKVTISWVKPNGDAASAQPAPAVTGDPPTA